MRINASQFRQLVNQQKNMASRLASPRKGKQGKKNGKSKVQPKSIMPSGEFYTSTFYTETDHA